MILLPNSEFDLTANDPLLLVDHYLNRTNYKIDGLVTNVNEINFSYSLCKPHCIGIHEISNKTKLNLSFPQNFLTDIQML